MNDLSQYAQISVVADALLSVILLFLWLIQRKERHALFWGLGQFSIGVGSAVWLYSADLLALPLRQALAAALLVGGISGYWAGTRYFLGTLRRGDGGRLLLAALALTLLVWLVWRRHPGLLVSGSFLLMGSMIAWTGAQLARGGHGYRLLGLTLVVRGLFNVTAIVTLTPAWYQPWFVLNAVLKSLSVLGLIYAVLSEVQQRYGRTIETLSNGFLIRDRRGYVQLANERCARLFGYASAAELVGRHVCELVGNLSRERADQYFARLDQPGNVYPLIDEGVVRLHDGRSLPIEMLASPYRERGTLYCLVQMLDISERKKKDAALTRAARIDSVTGFCNRHALDSRLAWTIAEAGAGACAVLFIDLDRFKRINDSFGHAVGDELLRVAAARIAALLGPDDTLARFGGDEFIVVLSGLRRADCRALARACGEQLLAELARAYSLGHHHGLVMSASIGVACYPDDGDEPDTLVRHADIAMYEAKKAGRGELRFFNEQMNAAARDALVIDGALRQAIARDEFTLVYQAITDARSGRLCKVEALLRWHSGQLGTVAPDRFIPVAEDSGMIVAIGTWVLQQACRQMAQWRQGALADITISINVSAWQLVDPAFLALVREALASNGLRASQLELELTERVLIDDGLNVRSVLEQLRALGVSISLDDFGTGYSSLSYLTQFELNTLKIDRAFVMDIEHSKRSGSLVHAIIAMGHSLGLQMVAEGVETAGQARILEQMGCHYLQGYHIARPLAPADLLHFAGATVSAA